MISSGSISQPRSLSELPTHISIPVSTSPTRTFRTSCLRTSPPNVTCVMGYLVFYQALYCLSGPPCLPHGKVDSVDTGVSAPWVHCRAPGPRSGVCCTGEQGVGVATPQTQCTPYRALRVPHPPPWVPVSTAKAAEQAPPQLSHLLPRSPRRFGSGSSVLGRLQQFCLDKSASSFHHRELCKQRLPSPALSGRDRSRFSDPALSLLTQLPGSRQPEVRGAGPGAAPAADSQPLGSLR